MAKKRRLDIHVDFQFVRAKKTSRKSSDDVLEDIAKHIEKSLEGWPVRVTNVSWERRDDEANQPIDHEVLE